jgi:F420 biosynthesis protein FbiB-like protein
VRRFKPDPVPDSVLTRILSTATLAPSAHNRQPWRFCVLTTPEIKKKLADAMSIRFEEDLQNDGLDSVEINKRVTRSRARINEAPALVILCVDMSDMDVYPDTARKKAEYLMAVQSTANAGMQMLLAAHAEGLAGVWVCSPLFAQNTVRDALQLQKTWEPQAMFFLGYPKDVPEARERKSMKEISIFL